MSKPNLQIARPIVQQPAPAQADAPENATPTTDELLTELGAPAPGAEQTAEPEKVETQETTDETSAPTGEETTEEQPDEKDQRIADLERQLAEREEEAVRAKAAPIPKVSDTTLLSKSAQELQERLEVARERYDDVTDIIDSLGSEVEYTDGSGKVWTRQELIERRAAIRNLVNRELPNALAAVQSRATVAATVRKQYASQFIPNTPAAKMRAAVAAEFAGMSSHPDFDRAVAEITEHRLKTASAKPAPTRAPALPSGSANRRAEARPTKANPDEEFANSPGGEEHFTRVFGR